jgi:hypothetical protein
MNTAKAADVMRLVVKPFKRPDYMALAALVAKYLNKEPNAEPDEIAEMVISAYRADAPDISTNN